MNEITLFDIVERHALGKPDAIAFTFIGNEGETSTLTYAQLALRVRAIAARLQCLHRRGDRILLMYQPGLDFIAAILACFAAGMVAVPVQPLQNRRVLPRLTGILENAGCRTILTNNALRQALLRSIPDLASATPQSHWLCSDAIADAGHTAFRKAQVTPSSLAFLQYTSGSTGAPKGVMVSHQNLLANETLIRRAFGHDSSTVFAGWLPLYHDMGLIGNVFQPLYLGIHAVLFAPMRFLTSPATWLRTISDWRASTSGAPSFAYELCVNRIADDDMEGIDLSSWSVAFNGAEPVKARVMQAFARRFAPYGFREEAFYPCYGMAEATLFLSGGVAAEKARLLKVDARALAANIIEPDAAGTALVSCGHAHGGHSIDIVDPNSLAVLAEGQVGEIWVGGPSVASGYWGNSALSEATFRALNASGAGPFLRTGDLGFTHQGELFVTGRLKDLIIVRGQNHYPDDIEATVYDGHDALKPGGAAAFTVGEESDLKLVVVAEVQRLALAGLDRQTLDAMLARTRKEISEKHGLRLADLVLIKPATLPKTSSGKVRRSHCRALYQQGQLERIAVAAPFGADQQHALAEST